MAGRESGSSNRKIRQYRKPLNINLGIIIFSVIFVYVVICVFLYFTQKHIMGYEVKNGSLSIGNVYQGIAMIPDTLIIMHEKENGLALESWYAALMKAAS